MIVTPHKFHSDFFDYMDVGARRSATALVPIIANTLKPRSVLDVGCGRGIWISEWQKAGVSDCIGVDGHYVDRACLAISRESFTAWDLSGHLDLKRRFDLVQSLEVAQCIAAAHADMFIDNLCRHGELVIFSAAVPGQGGEGHINEQTLDYWCEKFRSRGFTPFDWIRPTISGYRQIEPWYRYNALLFVANAVGSKLPVNVQAMRLLSDAQVADIAPFTWRARNATLRCLPPSVVHRLAMAKHMLHNLSRGGAAFR